MMCLCYGADTNDKQGDEGDPCDECDKFCGPLLVVACVFMNRLGNRAENTTNGEGSVSSRRVLASWVQESPSHAVIFVI